MIGDHIDALFAEIESHEFACRVNVASDFGTFVRGVVAQPAVHSLQRELEKESGRQWVLLRIAMRFDSIASETTDYRYEHHGDTALATYQLLIADALPNIARAFATRIRSSPSLWWARKTADHILAEFDDSVGTDSLSFYFDPGEIYSTVLASDAGETQWINPSVDVPVLVELTEFGAEASDASRVIEGPYSLEFTSEAA